MDFVIQWLWYLLAFVVGSLVAWLITVVTVKRTSEEEALADLPGSREIGSTVMQHVNWWLMALAFVLGLVLTLAVMIRRVKREVPSTRRSPQVRAAAGAGAAGAAKLKGGADVDAGAAAKPGAVAAGAAAGAAVAGGAAAAKFAEPYGAGSARVAAGPLRLPAMTSRATRTRCSITPPTARRTSRRSPKCGSGTSRRPRRPASHGGTRARPAAQLRWRAIADVPAGKHGLGSATPGAGGSGPTGWTIKGNEDSMLYHTTDSPSYKQTIAEVWFVDEETAEAAGFTHWKQGPRQGRRRGEIRTTECRLARMVLVRRRRTPTAAVLRAGRSRATRIRCSITRPKAPRTP